MLQKVDIFIMKWPILRKREIGLDFQDFGGASPEKPKQPGAFQEQAGAQEVPHHTNVLKS